MLNFQQRIVWKMWCNLNADSSQQMQVSRLFSIPIHLNARVLRHLAVLHALTQDTRQKSTDDETQIVPLNLTINLFSFTFGANT